MFTGLIEKSGVIESLTSSEDGHHLVISHDPWETDISEGESICVQGACLTAVAPSSTRFNVHLLQETVSRTSLQELGQGSKVNLERALAVGDRLGGHFVTGHVDGTATVSKIVEQGGDVIMTFTCDSELLAAMVPKGSVCIDGVSLTIAELTDEDFTVWLIPHTLEMTSLSRLKTGNIVNIENDILGKHVIRYMQLAKEKQAD